MAGGMIGHGRNHLYGSMEGGRAISDREKTRNMANEQLKRQAEANRQNSQISGVTTGAMTGAQVGGPWGAVIGGAVGLLAGSLFS